MVRSDPLLIEVKQKHKTAELVIGFIRLPGVTNLDLIHGFTASTNEQLAPDNAWVENPRFRTASPITEEIIFDVYELASPIVWGVVLVVLLAILVGVLGTLCIVLYLRVISLEKVLGEIGRTIDEAKADKEAALAAGKISEDYAKQLNEKLDEAKKKADDAGVADWWDMLEKILPLVPLGLLALGAIVLMGYLPKLRRD